LGEDYQLSQLRYIWIESSNFTPQSEEGLGREGREGDGEK